jgi:hypothetical protein
VVDGFLKALNAMSAETTTRAFADDIGSVIPSLNLIPKFYRAFNVFERISGLGLKAKKCVLIPLGKPLTSTLTQEIREYLTKHCPKWATFNIRDASEYLGFIIGPNGGNDASWVKAFNNFNTTVDQIANAKLAPSAGIALYNLKAFPRLSYIPQLCTPPAQTDKIEKHAIETIMHLPHNALPKNAAFCLDQIGMPKFTPIKLLAEAACARTAHKTSRVWQEQLRQINAIREECGPIAARTSTTKHGHKDSHRWATCAFVDNLSKAYAIEFPTPPPETHKRFSLQAHIQKHIAPNHFEHNIVNTTFHRMYKFIAPLAINEEQLKRTMHITVQAVKQLSPMFGGALIRTWNNGWVTDSRVGASNASPCRLGCDPHNPNNTDRQVHYLECERLWKNIHRSYKKYANIQLTISRFHSLCIIPPWESETTDPKEITHHLMCLGAAVDTYNFLSNNQKLQAGKCHAKGDKRPHKVKNCTIADAADEAFRRINRLNKIPKTQPPDASTYRTTQDTDDRTSRTSSSSDSSSNSSSSNDSNDSAKSSNDGQLRVTSSSKPTHGHKNNNNHNNNDNHDHATSPNDGQLRDTSSSKSRSSADRTRQPAKDFDQHTRQLVQASSSPPLPSVGAPSDCMSHCVASQY